jgi:hypothetical protein
VRAAPRREVTPDDAGRLFFAPELVPLSAHPLVAELGPGAPEQVIVQHLYRYLDFTTKLEQLVVNPTVLAIAYDDIGLGVPQRARLDAHKIYCDEAYHAVFSQDILRQVAERTGVLPRLPDRPDFLVRLRRTQAELPPELREIAGLFFVVMSETVISRTLADMRADPRVVPAVTEMIRDHATDEARHHAYFAQFLRTLWAGLEPAQRIAGARLVPEFVHAFLEPDRPAVRAELRGYGMTDDAVEQVLAEAWPDAEVAASVREYSARTVSYFRDVGALDEPEIEDRFAAAGLLP